MNDSVIVPPTVDPHLMALIRMAVREDLGHGTYGTVQGDRTVELAIPLEMRGRGEIVARGRGIFCGGFLMEAIVREYQVGMVCEVVARDGEVVEVDEKVGTISGSMRAILSCERVVLNFLTHLSGVATLTRRYVEAVALAVADEKKRPVVCDTRKTLPGFRVLDKYAVRCGGGVNHRMGLYDGVMLKDNHLAALRERLGAGGAGVSLGELCARVRGELDSGIWLWLEVDTLEQLGEALAAGKRGADVILLDNFSVEDMGEAVKMRDGRKSKVLLEASGGVNLGNIGEIARTGVDRISVGALTHSAPVLDLSMEVV